MNEKNRNHLVSTSSYPPLCVPPVFIDDSRAIKATSTKLIAVSTSLEPHLVFYRRAIARPFRVHPPPVRRSLVQIVFDHLMRCCRSSGKPAAHLVSLLVRLRVEAEVAQVLIARLLYEVAEIDSAHVDTGGRPCLETVSLEA
jgi:hypothetical protein